MGGFFTKVFSRIVGKKELKIIIIGLDNSGKTTILSTPPTTQTNSTSTKSSQPSPVPPAPGSHRLQHGNSQLQEPPVPSMGPGRTELHQVTVAGGRQYWEMYYPNTNAVLYVVDSNDTHRLPKAAEELRKVLDVSGGKGRKKSCRECRCWCWPTSKTSKTQPPRSTSAMRWD